MQAAPLLRNAFFRSLLFCAALTVLATGGLEAAAVEQTRKIVGAANAFVATLDDAQRVKVNFAFDEVLRAESRSGAPPFGRDEFFVSFLGKPSATEPWIIQFGGHHLALNITIAGEQGVLTPSLIAVQPAKFTLDGKTVRPMGRETDKALELVQALTDEQREQAILGSQVRDLVLGPGQDGETIEPEGLKTSALNEEQRTLLLELVAEWSGIIHDAAAAEKMSEIEANLADTWFAWSGPLEAGKAYFRIQGPTIIFEFAPQRSEMHLHSMYRDPTNDYGRKYSGQ